MEIFKKVVKLLTIKEPNFLYFKYSEWNKYKILINIILSLNKNYKKCTIFKSSYKNHTSIVIVGLKWYGKNVKRRTHGLAKEYISDGRISNCIYCSNKLTDDNVTIDHILPISKGGSNCKVNLIVCCKDCNSERGDSDFYEYLITKKPELHNRKKLIWI